MSTSSIPSPSTTQQFRSTNLCGIPTAAVQPPVQSPAPDVRQSILASLRNEAPAPSVSLTPLENERVAMTYRRAVLAVCRAIEESTPNPSDLSSAGILAQDLLPTHKIGEHLSATRRFFGLVP